MKNVGTVKKYLAERGFGFITQENGKDIFFHIKSGKNVNAGAFAPELSMGKPWEPKEGDRLMFEIMEGKKGAMASPWCFAEDWENAERNITTGKAAETAPKPEVADIGESAHVGKLARRHERRCGNNSRRGDENRGRRPRIEENEADWKKQLKTMEPSS